MRVILHVKAFGFGFEAFNGEYPPIFDTLFFMIPWTMSTVTNSSSR
jgi:hypothetical protein